MALCDNRPAMFNRGFTLIEVSIAMGVIALVLTGGMLLLFRDLTDSREQETIEKLKVLKRAIVGDPGIETKETRTDLGYVGYTDSVTASWTTLWIQNTQQ